MSTLRYFFAATALANGTVLVEGGCNKINCTTVTTSAELYDPRTGQWTLTAPMKTGRDYHTASLVNGKVLVSGGYTIAGASTSVEMYDPATATWSTMGSMISGRALHSATTLFDGRVLVAGGLVGYLPSDLSETYDPVANKWSLTSNLTVKRAGPQLVLLPNHTALAAGGYSYTRPYYFNLASCELFDSVAGTWTLTADMTTPRYLNALAMLNNGQVLAVGGISSSSVVLSTAELYMP
jgi:N-acetylneuraminic acid mutarotase